MIQIGITYQGGLRCQATHGSNGKILVTDAPVATQGRGEFFSPTDLVAAALGTCIATVMAGVAERDKIDLTGMRISVEKEMSTGMPRRLGKLKARVTVPCPLTEQQRAKLERAAHHCPVHQSFHPEIEAPIEFIYP